MLIIGVSGFSAENAEYLLHNPVHISNKIRNLIRTEEEDDPIGLARAIPETEGIRGAAQNLYPDANKHHKAFLE